MVLTPALTIVPGAWGGEMVSSTFWGHSRPAAGKQIERLPLQDRGAGGTGCSETTAELLTGPGRGVAATGFQQDCQMKGQWCSKPRLPASTGLQREGGLGEVRFHTGPQHQQVFEEFAGPSGLPSSSSSSASASSLLTHVRTPSSSFLWACSTSSVRRVKDWEAKEHKLDQRIHLCFR